MLERIAPTDSHVLIQGENGTGKELIARNLHRMSRRSGHSFVVVNCAAIPESLVASELFGHERGAFTGADKKRTGLYDAAHEGTLFLDEIGELPLSVQPALLRAVQFGEIRPVGSDHTRRVDVRVVAATNRDLLDEVARGGFREDLYYRLAALRIAAPPLRERPEDIAVLARAFLARAAERTGRTLAWDEGALRLLATREWPGNIRELENVVTRISVLAAEEVITADAVRELALDEPGGRPRGGLPTLRLEDLERQAIAQALERHAGDKRAAADTLGIALRTLYNKVDAYGLK
jgi:transcriptional regulator with GAF, ATPase, and Fis domain